jgi:hypothetical protein
MLSISCGVLLSSCTKLACLKIKLHVVMKVLCELIFHYIYVCMYVCMCVCIFNVIIYHDIDL